VTRIDGISEMVVMVQSSHGGAVANEIIDAIIRLLARPVHLEAGEVHVATTVVISVERVLEKE
jgi:hypothetical protein